MTGAIAGPLLLVGCGKMGGALLQGWLRQGADPADILVVEPMADPHRVLAAPGVKMLAEPGQLPADLDPAVVILAVKPQTMDDVAAHYGRFAAPDTVFLSIAAGTKIAYFEQHFGDDAAIVRVMPNTPAAVERGMSVLCANGRVSAAQRETCTGLMAAVGETAWIADEALMDAVTAVSGSGPAYVFLLIECLAQAGVEAGLSEELAAQLAAATVSGAGELARQSEETPSQLRVNVTSPGGTTQAALEVLMADDGLAPLLRRAVDAAARRSRELGN